MPDVALPCGSASTSRTRVPQDAIIAARLTAVVVFPTPPFWLATAIVLAMLALNLTHVRPYGYSGMFHVKHHPVKSWHPVKTYADRCCAERNASSVERAPGVSPGSRRASPNVSGCARSSLSTISLDNPAIP